MAYPISYAPAFGTGFAAPAYASYGGSYGVPATYSFAPTAFAQPIAVSAAAHEGSQAEEQHSQQAVSVSGFADPNAAYFGQPWGQPTLLQAPTVRRPGYNERLVAWRNRQKAFNRYKKATKQAIKNANTQQLAFPGYGGYPGFGATAFGGAPFGATYINAPFGYEQFAAAPAEQEAYGTFGDFSQAAPAQEQHEEPEIRGTQV